MVDESWMSALRKVELFRDLPIDSVRQIAAELREYRYGEGEIVVRQGDAGQHGRMFILLDGTAAADVDGNVVATYGPGDYFGEMSVLDGGSRSATVTATSPVTLAGLASFNLRGVVVDEPTIAMHLIEVLTRRLRAANAGDH